MELTVLVTGYEGRGQGIYSDLGNYLVWGGSVDGGIIQFYRRRNKVLFCF